MEGGIDDYYGSDINDIRYRYELYCNWKSIIRNEPSDTLEKFAKGHCLQISKVVEIVKEFDAGHNIRTDLVKIPAGRFNAINKATTDEELKELVKEYILHKKNQLTLQNEAAQMEDNNRKNLEYCYGIYMKWKENIKSLYPLSPLKFTEIHSLPLLMLEEIVRDFEAKCI